MTYRGRFAPSPTGPLHFGSLVSAVASYLQARSQHGYWFVRIEDIDPPREQSGAADAILRTLEAFGLLWDGEISYQSRRLGAYADAIDRLREAGVLYACSCSRREIADSSVHGIDGLVYPGTCRDKAINDKARHSLRIRSDSSAVHFDDRWQGRILRSILRDYGDFVVQRTDGLYAYQLAVVIDDAAQSITEVVRGTDLLESTPRQIFLQQALGLPTPNYAHHAVVLNADGQKLSKQTGAIGIEAQTHRILTLTKALQFLNQPTDWIQECDWRDFWSVAARHWQPEKLRARRSTSTDQFEVH